MTKYQHTGDIMKKMTFIKFALPLILAFSSVQANAKWYSATGEGEDRNAAVNDAIRNIILQSGASVHIEESFKNGVMQKDSFSIKSTSPIKSLVVLNEQTSFHRVTVNIKAFINENQVKKGCSVANIKKTMIPVAFKYSDSQAYQGSMGIEGIEKIITKQFHENLRMIKTVNVKTPLNINLPKDYSKEVDNSFVFKNLTSIASRENAQYVLIGTINSVAVSKVGNNLLTNLLFSDTRSLNFDIDIYDAINDELVFHQNYQMEADWPYAQSDYIDIKGNNFKSTAYGQRMYGLLKDAANDISYEIQCAPVSAKVIDIDGDDIIINIGKNNGITKNTEFTVVQRTSVQTTTGKEYESYEDAAGRYKAVSIYPNASKLKPADLQNNVLNININDVVTVQ